MSDMVLAFWTRIQNIVQESDERGATAVEYGLMVALIAVAIIVAVTLLGTNLSNKFNFIAGKIA